MCCGRGRRRAAAPKRPGNTAKAGRRVKVTSGQYKGKIGTILSTPRVGTYKVLLDGDSVAKDFYGSLLKVIS